MPEIRPPFGYGALKLLDRSDHVRLLGPGQLPPFVSRSQIVPLAYDEIVPAAWHYPIVFVHDPAADQYNVVGVMGLSRNRNSFGGDDGWDAAAYPPAYVRRYPFCMASVVRDDTPDPDLLVCVEADHVSEGPAEGAVRLFLEDGQPTPRWTAIEGFLATYEADLAAARAFAARLVELELLDTFTANVTRAGAEPFSLTGMWRVNEARLAELDAATVLALHRSGHLARVTLHLFSLQRFQSLLQREGGQVVSPPVPAADPVEAVA